MVTLQDLTQYSDQLLAADTFRDYCPNGLQVQGRREVGKLVSGVTASLALIDAAIAAKADALLVHHGYFWKGEDPCIVGMKYRRLERLIVAGISLLAYHLPLDAHAELGNNAQLARRLDLPIGGRFGPDVRNPLAMFGELPEPLSAEQLGQRIGEALGRPPLHIEGGPSVLRRIGWCTGAAQGFIVDAAALGLDAFISGESSEPTVHTARECGIHFFAAGHHATERYGVQALGAHLADHFSLEHQFIDIDNPV